MVLVGGLGKLLERMKDPNIRKRLKRELESGKWDPDVGNIRECYCLKTKEYEGKTIKEIAEIRGVHWVDALCDLLIANEGIACHVHLPGKGGLGEKRKINYLQHPAVIVGSDGWVLAPYGPLHVGKPNTRSYGTYPRILGRYVREYGALTLQEAVRKMTSMPAQKLGLKDRGLIREGMWADVVVFDPHRVMDTATFEDPHQYPVGIEYILVNGEITMEKGEHTGVLAGKVLRKPPPHPIVR